MKKAVIDTMPEGVRRWLERALIERNFSGYDELEKLCRGKGYVISRSAIHRYGQKIERRFAAIKASTEAARMLTEGAADDQDARSEAVVAMVQTEMFESLLDIQEAASEEIPREKRLELMSKAAKNIATLTRASVTLKRFQSEVREDERKRVLAEQAEKLKDAGKELGVSEDTLRVIRQKLGVA